MLSILLDKKKNEDQKKFFILTVNKISYNGS